MKAWIIQSGLWIALYGGTPWLLMLTLALLNPAYMSRFIEKPDAIEGFVLTSVAVFIQVGTILLRSVLVNVKNKATQVVVRAWAFLGFIIVIFIILFTPALFQMRLEIEPSPGAH